MTPTIIKTVRPISDKNSASFKQGPALEELTRIWAGTWQPVLNHDYASPPSGASTRRFSEYALHPLTQIGIGTQLSAAFSTGWNFQPGNDYKRSRKYEQLDTQIIDSIMYQVDDVNWRHDTFESNLEAFTEYAMQYGFEIAEPWFNTIDNFTAMVGLKTKEPYDWEIYVDQYRNINRLQYTYSGQIWEQGVPLDGFNGVLNDHFIVGTWPSLKGGNHYGWSVIQPTLIDLKALELLEQAQVIGSQALAVNPIIHWYIANLTNKTELDKIRTALQENTMLSALSLPSSRAVGDKAITGEPAKNHIFEILKDRASHEGVEMIKYIIELIQKRVLRTHGIPDDLGFSNVSAGSWAKADVELNLFLARIQNLQRWIEATVNKYIVPLMIKYNWSLPNDYRLPKFKFKIPKEDTLAKASEYLIKWFDKGVVDEHYVQELLGFPEFSQEKAIENEQKLDKPTETIEPKSTNPIELDKGQEMVDEGTEVTSQEIQTNPDLTLNGAQIESVRNIVTDVAIGRLSRVTGLGMLEIALNLTPAQAIKTLGDAGIKVISPTPDQPLPQ